MFPFRSLAEGTTNQPAAAELYQALVDTIDRKFWARDWETVIGYFTLPNRLSSQDADRRIEDREDLLMLLRSARDTFEAAGVSEYHRICRCAYFQDDTQTSLVGQHDSYVMRSATMVMPRYAGYLSMELIDGG